MEAEANPKDGGKANSTDGGDLEGELVLRTNHFVKEGGNEVRGPHAEDNRRHEPADEALPRLLRRQLDQRRLAPKPPEHVCVHLCRRQH